jgi:hypothetical protein
VYYPGADGNTVSKVFTLADAHGNNVGDIDHLFAENVVVKVILDVTTGMAFVQNADTNAYLETQLASKRPNTWTPTAAEVGAAPANLETLVKTQRVYTAIGPLVKSEGGSVFGTGIATIFIDPSGLARIDFSIVITNPGIHENVFLYGIASDLLRERNPNIPIIIPITGGYINWYKYPEMTFADNKTVYAAFPAAADQYWRIARIICADGVWGDYPETVLLQNERIIGTCYGIVVQGG